MNIYLTLCSIRGPKIDNSNYWNYRPRLGPDSDNRSDLFTCCHWFLFIVKKSNPKAKVSPPIHYELRKGGKRTFANFQVKWTSFWSKI